MSCVPSALAQVEALQRQVQDLTGERDTLRARARELEESQGRELADLRSRAETAEREAAEARSDRDAGAARLSGAARRGGGLGPPRA